MDKEILLSKKNEENIENVLLKKFLIWYSTQNIILSETANGIVFRKSNIGSPYTSVDEIIDLFNEDKTK